MGLNEQAAACKQKLLDQLDPAAENKVGEALAAIRELQPSRRALGVGARAPDFDRPTIHGERLRLTRQLRRGPVVLSFYRGGWCPFCNLELRSWQERLDELHALGAELVAVAPEAGDSAREKAESVGLTFPLVTDANQEVAESYGLVFELPEAARAVQSLFDAPLDRLNADGTWRLPVPATYIVMPGGMIRWAHVDDDYTCRAEPDEVIEELRALTRRRASA